MYSNRRNLSGLGAGSSAEEYTGPIGAALMFIPGVGTIIGGIVEVAGILMDKLFGWGDPNSIPDLFKLIVQLRLQLADTNKQLGIQDGFILPPDYTGSADELANLAMFVTNEYKKKVPVDYAELDMSWAGATPTGDVKNIWTAYPSSERRSDSYAVIKWLHSVLTSEQMAGENAQLQITPQDVANYQSANPDATTQAAVASGAIAPTQVPSDPSFNTTQAATSTALPATVAPSTPVAQAGFSPLLIGGAGLLLLLLLMSGDDQSS